MPSSGPDRPSSACSSAVRRRDLTAAFAILLSMLGPACVRSPPQLAAGEAGLAEAPRASLTLLHLDDLPDPFELTTLAVELDEAPAAELRLDDGALARGAENVAFHGAIAPGPHRLRVTLSYRIDADEASASGLERTVKLASSLPFEAAEGTRTVVDLMTLPTVTPPSVESPPKLVFVVGVEPLANASARRSLISSPAPRRARHGPNSGGRARALDAAAKAYRVPDRVAAPIVVEVGVDGEALFEPRADPASPAREHRGGIGATVAFASVQAHVGEGRGHEARVPRDRVVQDQRGAKPTKRVEHGLDQPARIADLHRHPAPRRHALEEGQEARDVGLEARRQLHQERAELLGEALGA
jgi:hypothetical protein